MYYFNTAVKTTWNELGQTKRQPGENCETTGRELHF